MPKWLQLVVATSLTLITAFVAYAVFLQPSEADELERESTLTQAIVQAGAFQTLQSEYHDQHGAYSGSVYTLTEGIPRSNVEDQLARLNFLKGISIKTSHDGQAYLIVADFSEDGDVACAALHDSGAPVDTSDVLLKFHSSPEKIAAVRGIEGHGWRLNSEEGVTCRKTSWPLNWLHWTGLGYVSNEKILEALESY